MRPRVLITRRPPGRTIEMLEAVCDVDLWTRDEAMPYRKLVAAVGDIDGLYCMLIDNIDAGLIEAAPRLRIISSMAVGVDNIDLAACTTHGIPVGHTPGVLAATVADMAVALLLAATRRLVEGVDYVKAGRWRAWEPGLLLGRDLHGSTVGIVGLGGVGREIAGRLSGFNCQVTATNRTPYPDVAEMVPIDRLLSESDHVIVAIASTPETRHLIDAAALRKMQPHATLVNVSRGDTVDQRALAKALRTGEIAAAALDVTDPEPIALDDPLLELPNCVVVPHLGSSTVRTRTAMGEMAARNLLAGLSGEQLEACANPAPEV